MTTITAKAVPAKNYHFVGWSDGQLSTIRSDDISALTSDVQLIANFELRYNLVYNVSETAGGNIVKAGVTAAASAQAILHGEDAVAVTATPNAGYHFVSWSDGVTTATRTDKCIVSDMTVTASFSQSYKLMYVARNGGGINAATTKIVSQYGTSGPATLVTATAATGYHFTCWSDGNKVAARTDTFAADKVLYANFAQTYNINYNTNDGSSSVASTVGGSVIFV